MTKYIVTIILLFSNNAWAQEDYWNSLVFGCYSSNCEGRRNHIKTVEELSAMGVRIISSIESKDVDRYIELIKSSLSHIMKEFTDDHWINSDLAGEWIVITFSYNTDGACGYAAGNEIVLHPTICGQNSHIIAHEIGHVVGLHHTTDMRDLMCGGPNAKCIRPIKFNGLSDKLKLHLNHARSLGNPLVYPVQGPSIPVPALPHTTTLALAIVLFILRWRVQ